MNRLMTALVAAAALWTEACGGGGATINPPPPTGKYSLASLNGTYAFVTTGEAITSGAASATPFSRTGSFTADGAGGVKAGGIYDVVNDGGFNTTVVITGGSYTVSADGRGTLTFNITSSGAPATINFAIVLTSTSGGLMMDETFSGNHASTGSGNFILQSAAAFSAGVSGAYVFDFTGSDPGNNPESLVGQFTASAGTMTGTEDANDNFTLTSGSITGTFAPDPINGPTSGRGTAVIAGQNYVFYIVDANRVRFISDNTATGGSGPMLTGDAVLSASVPPSPSGSFAFLVSGSSTSGGLIRVGRFTVSGSSLSNILMDKNNGGSETEPSISSSNTNVTYDSTTGRGMLSFQSSVANVYSFVFYLSSANSGVIQEVSGPAGSTSAVVVADGSILAQSGSPFSSSNVSGPYAMNWSGLVTASGLGMDEEDLLSQVTFSNLNLSGTSDIFQFTGVTLNTDLGTAGSINFNGGDGTGGDGKSASMTVKLSGISQINMIVYVVNPELAFFVSGNNSPTRIVAGLLEAQR